MSLFNILIVFYALIIGVYFFIKRKYSYWENLKVPSIKFDYRHIINRPPNALLFKQFYEEFRKGKSPFGGFYMLLKPMVMITDLDLAKRIMVKDFNSFVNRSTNFHDPKDPLSEHLFNLEGQEWKNLRSKLSPTFTSGKMKFMFPTIVAIGKHFTTTLERETKISKELELKDLLARFTTDVIGSVAFGLECNSLNDPQSKFREYGRKVFSQTSFARFKMLIKMTFPSLARTFDINGRNNEIIQFFMNITNQTVDHREKNNVKRNDFMDLLIGLKAQNPENFNINHVASNAFIFFLAGFETSSTVMSFALFELAQNPDIQEKARQEVKRVLQKFNGELNYESMNEMKYVLQVLNESLRKYPPATELNRLVESDYTESTTGFVFKKGTSLFIPVYAIHHDPEYYPNPDVFDPNRFSEEQVKARHPYAFLPFGEGPRNCIGLRFGVMQAQIGLITLLNAFRFSPTDKTPKRLEFDPNGLVLTSKGGLWLNVDQL
jgi:cytochrome P450 family 6